MTPETPGGRAPESIYLDHAAATPLLPEVAAAIAEAQATAFANPSSPHAAGRRAKRILEDARSRILALLGGDLGPGARLVFTSGATEANRLGALGLSGGRRGRILSSARDHASLAAAARELASRGWETASVPLSSRGTLALAEPEGHRSEPGPGRDGVEILCATLACGQSGSWEDVAGLVAWASARPGRLVHVDATQALLADDDRPPFGLPAGLVATLALAPHKFGGPRGIGGLVVRRDVELAPLVPGTQEAGLRGGTEPVDLAVGFARAAELAVADRAVVARRVAALRDRLEARLLAAAAAAGIGAHAVGSDGTRAPHIATIAFPGLDRQALVMAADLEGVACASGTACASGSSEPAPALVAMRLSDASVRGAIRLSLGPNTTGADVDTTADRFATILARMAPQPGA